MEQNPVYVQQVPYACCLLFACRHSLASPKSRLRPVLLFSGVSHSLYSTLVSFSSSFTASEDLLGRLLAHRIEEATFGELARNSFIHTVLDIVDILVARDLGLVEFVYTMRQDISMARKVGTMFFSIQAEPKQYTHMGRSVILAKQKIGFLDRTRDLQGYMPLRESVPRSSR